MPQYYYHGDQETWHPRLGLLRPGANDVQDDLVELADACVEAGLLYHTPDEFPMEAPPTGLDEEEEPDA